MFTTVLIVLGLAAAGACLVGAFKAQISALRYTLVGCAGAVLLLFLFLSSFRFVGENQVGIVVKNALGGPLPPGQIIATDGENGPQARVLPPGWHPLLLPLLYDIEYVPIVTVEESMVGVLTASDGKSLPPGTTYAPEWPDSDRKLMAEDATHFLTVGNGFKGPQSTVLAPGKYRINTKLFTVEMLPVTNVKQATVGVVKSNVGEKPPMTDTGDTVQVVEPGQRGIWRSPLVPDKYYLNTKAMEVTVISTKKTIVRYTALTRQERGTNNEIEEREISVRTSDGFTFPVDVRIEYMIKREDAPRVVAAVGNDQDELREVLNSAVRAIFRNNAETVKALDYVQQRSQQESQSLIMLAEEMSKIGVTVTACRIGDVGDESTLGTLLTTQKEREIAVQEQITLQEQQRAAEQQKELARIEQEAEEEKRLATATYEVQIADEAKKTRIIAAEGESEALRIEAQAQADAYRMIAEQIGKGNAALVEVLRIVGQDGIEITPRVMVVGSGSDGSTAETTALIGTMLDTMIGSAATGAPDARRTPTAEGGAGDKSQAPEPSD